MADLSKYAYTPSPRTSASKTWPTLQEMISDSTRLVTFVANLDPRLNNVAPYLLDEFTFLFENPFSVTDASNFSCIADRPLSVFGSTSKALASDRLPLMNHFLDSEEGYGIQVPNTSALNITNAVSGGAGNLGVAAASVCSPGDILYQFRTFLGVVGQVSRADKVYRVENLGYS
ncbi:hypothetical protein MMC25_005399 [Agyrium rufum]|nr:hypothetical protein [Agyrium rufum]